MDTFLQKDVPAQTRVHFLEVETLHGHEAKSCVLRELRSHQSHTCHGMKQYSQTGFLISIKGLPAASTVLSTWDAMMGKDFMVHMTAQPHVEDRRQSHDHRPKWETQLP